MKIMRISIVSTIITLPTCSCYDDNGFIHYRDTSGSFIARGWSGSDACSKYERIITMQ